MGVGMAELTEKEIELLYELGRDDSLSQRRLAEKVRISLGATNLFLRKLARKGLLKVKKINKRNLQYVLTPEGFSERARWNFLCLEQNLNYFANAKSVLIERIDRIIAAGYRSIYIFGSSEQAEIAFLGIMNSDITLKGFIGKERGRFLDYPVFTVDEILEQEISATECVLILNGPDEEIITRLQSKLKVFHV